LKILQLTKVDFPYIPSVLPKAAPERKSQKVSVRFLSEQSIGHEPPRAPIRYMFGRPSGRESLRTPICKDVRTQKSEDCGRRSFSLQSSEC